LGEWDRERELRCLNLLVAGKDAWREFYALYGHFMAIQLRESGVDRPQDREDVYQDVVLKLLGDERRVLRRFLEADSGLSFSTLLRTVVRSAVIDRYRRARFWRNAWFFPSSEVPHAGHSGPERDLLREVRLHCMFTSLAQRMKDQTVYQVLSLRYITGNSVNGIAVEMGLSPNAVSQRLRVYQRRLRQDYFEDLMELLHDEV
jgi:RNA polymerase sigma factor (sigma-70 family)